MGGAIDSALEGPVFTIGCRGEESTGEEWFSSILLEGWRCIVLCLSGSVCLYINDLPIQLNTHLSADLSCESEIEKLSERGLSLIRLTCSKLTASESLLFGRVGRVKDSTLGKLWEGIQVVTIMAVAA